MFLLQTWSTWATGVTGRVYPSLIIAEPSLNSVVAFSASRRIIDRISLVLRAPCVFVYRQGSVMCLMGVVP